MPSRRKSAHTTKIERVPRYEVYHGEEDLDERTSSDGTLDLSMKRIKSEPKEYADDGTDLASRSAKSPSVENESTTRNELRDVGDGSDIAIDEHVEGSTSSSGQKTDNDAKSNSAADDVLNVNDSGDHVTTPLTALSSVCTPGEQLFIDSNGQAISAVTGLSLFHQSSKGKPVRPFKLYTTSRDLLSGLSTQGTPTLAAYSVPIALAQVAAASPHVPLAFASMPVVTGAPMIPVIAPLASSTGSASATAATGTGTDATCTSTSPTTTNVTAKSTSSTTDVHLMTLATEADKILRERHESGESIDMNSDSMEGNTADDLSTNGEEMEQTMVGMEEGTVLKIPSLSSKASNGKGEDSLTLIQKRAVAAAVAASNPQKSKKRRQTLPDDLKDNAYWERRRKNNEAAKRSRDARRAKEDQIAIRAALLEQENIRLKIEVAALKEETVRLRSKLYGNNNS